MQRPVDGTAVPSLRGHNAQHNMRTLSVDEALQYTPLTTSVLPPFDRIPIPEVCRAKESGRVSTSLERKLVQQTLGKYPVKKVKERLSALLDGDTLAEIKFKQPPSTGPSMQASGKKIGLSLTPLAQTVFDMTNIDYRYPTPTSPDRSKPKKSTHPKAKAPPTPSISISPEPRSKVLQNGLTLPYNQSQWTPVVQTPASPRGEHEQLQRSPKRRKVSPVDEQSLRIRTQREVVDASLQQFDDFLLEIFEGQDQLELRNEGAFPNQENPYFENWDDDDETDPRLSLKILDKIQTQLKKISGHNRLRDVPSDHIRRLQQICENAIERTQTMNLKLPSDPSSDDQDRWQHCISKAENGAASACVYIHTTLGSTHDESLISMDVLRWIPNVLVNVFENCLIPVVEARPEGATADFFKIASDLREDIRRLLDICRKLLELMTTACADVKGCDSYVNTVEFLAAKLIFIQNASLEKQSVLGLQTFEKTRKSAMAVLAKIYSRFPKERPAIMDEVLSSLDKLPSTSRSARQFRLGDGKSIQLISALFMQLVQTTCMEPPKMASREPKTGQKEQLEDDDSDESDIAALEVDPVDNEDPTPAGQLQRKVDQLFNSAAKSAQDIVSYLVGRASKTTKSGDSPYRSILDLFVEDLIVVLPSYEWPSSELLLRALANRMIDLARNDKAAQAKNMALESLGVMGSAISDLKASIQNLSATLSRDEQASYSQVAQQLVVLADVHLQTGGIRAEDMIALNGPLATVAQHLKSQSFKQNLQRASASRYFLAHYAKLVSLTVQADSSNQYAEYSLDEVVRNILAMLSEASEAHKETNEEHITEDMAKLAFTMTIANLGFCRRLYDIVKTLASSLSSDQAMIRTRSLKSVLTVLESDSSFLDRDHTIADDIFRCASDESALVRDSALSLIARFIISKPALQQKGIKRLLECAEDTKVGVQRRAINHLKDIYLNDQRPQLRAAIARKFLQRLSDHEESIVTLANQTLEDIWIRPALIILQDNTDNAKAEVTVQDLTNHLMSCISPLPEELTPLLKTFLISILKKDSGSTRKLCIRIVEVLFERSISEEKNQAFLLVLTAFAEADSKLIPPNRLAKLQNYLSEIKSDNDLFMFRSAIGIFCCVLPDLSDSHKTLLKDIQDALMKSINKLGRRTELDAVMVCLRTIDGVLHNSERLIRLAASIFNQLLSKGLPTPSLLKLLRIAGSIGKQIDFEDHAQVFAKQIPSFTKGTVAAHLASTIYPLTKSDRPLEVRLIAFASLGSICQANPAQLNRPVVREAFFSVLRTDPRPTLGSPESELQAVVLRVFDELYGVRAAAKEKSDKAAKEGEQQGLKQLGGDSKTRDQDSAISAITSDVTTSVLNIALYESSGNALLAARTLASISHQGLIHPKQCLGAFVALGTSSDTKISNIGVGAHHILHEQHESHCEREYMSAIHQAFEYQQMVFKDPTGAYQPGNQAKLARCFQIICSSSSKYVKKFLSGLISRTVTEISGSEQLVVSMNQLLFTRFIVQNLAFVDHHKLDELLHAVLQLELAYSKGGSEVASAIETSLQNHPDIPVPTAPVFDGQQMVEMAPMMAMNPHLVVELKRIALAAANLMLLIEARSYLLRQYGLGRDVRSAMNNNKQAKETNKAPTRIHGITGDRFWNLSNSIVSALDNDEATVALCKDFVAAISIDDEVDMVGDEMPSIESLDVNGIVKGGTPSGRKRKYSNSTTNTPTKKAKNRSKKDSRRSTSISSMEDPEADYEG